MSFIPPDLSTQSALALANVTIAALCIAIISLLAERTIRNRSLPTRHGVLLAGVLLTAASPFLLCVAIQLGWGIPIALSWREVEMVEPSDDFAADIPSEPLTPAQPVIVEPPSESPIAESETPRPLTVGDLVAPGEVLQFELSPPVLNETSEAHVAVGGASPPSEARHIDWGPAIRRIGGWWLIIWITGSALAEVRLLVGWRRVRQMHAELQPLRDPELLSALSRAANVVGLMRVPRLMTSPRVPVPVVSGLWRPVIVLPLRLIDEVAVASIESILLHECAHLHRRDLWIGWLQRVAGMLFWWNIPLWAVQRRLNDLREDLCDNHVLAHHPDGRGYARVLLDLVSRASGSRPMPASVGLVEGPSSGLSARITRLLKEDRNMATRLTKRSAASILLLTGLLSAAICGFTLRTESVAADDGPQSVGEGDVSADSENPGAPTQTHTADEGSQAPAATPMDQSALSLINAPLYYDDQMLVLVASDGAAAVRFENIGNGIVQYEWRYLSAEDAGRDPQQVPSPHEMRGEGRLETNMTGPIPAIEAGPLVLSWSPATEAYGWVTFAPEAMQVLPVNRTFFSEQEIPQHDPQPALDLRSFIANIDGSTILTEDAEAGPTPRHYSAKVIYDDMVLVVANDEGVAAFEFVEPFVDGDLQTFGREGVRYRFFYRGFDGSGQGVDSSEVYELYKDGEYNQGELYLEAGPISLEWSKGDAEYGWVYFNPLEERCWLIGREYFEEFRSFDEHTGPVLDLLRFRQAPRPLTPSVNVNQTADPAPIAVADDADGEQEFEQQITQAMEAGIEFLVNQQGEVGSWTAADGLHQHAIGINSLALLSLLQSGRPVDDRTVALGLEWLREQDDPDQTYDIALMIMALAAANDDADDERIARLAALLTEEQIIHEGRGSWGYGGTGNWWDNSNTQYAVMGLYAAHNAGVDVGLEVVRRSLDHYLARQQGDVDAADGAGWNYQGQHGGAISGTMTTAGIASLLMLSEMLESQEEIRAADAARLDAAATSIEAGQRWLAHHFAVRENPGAGVSWVLCYLVSLGRACTLADLELIGDHDWYAEGAEYLVDGQNPTDGSWVSNSENDRVIATSMALLFLAAGDEADDAVSVRAAEPGTFTFNFENARWSEVFQQLSESAGMNIVMPPDALAGDRFTWRDHRHYNAEQALQVINRHLRQCGFELVSNGEVFELTPRPVVSPTELFARSIASDQAPVPIDVTLPAASDAAADSGATLILLHLGAAEDGGLGELHYFNESLGEGPDAIGALTVRLDKLRSDLATRPEASELRVQITADESLQYGAVVSVMDKLNASGVRDIFLSTGPTGDEVAITLGYLRDAMGRKVSDDVILSVPERTGSVEDAGDILLGLSQKLASDIGEGADVAADVVLTISVDPEVPADVVQVIIQHAAAAGFEKFALQALGGEAATDGEQPATGTDSTTESDGRESNIAGTVIEVDENQQRVTLSIGADDGGRERQQYSIWRKHEADAGFDIVALCEIIELTADQSVARVTVITEPERFAFPEPGDDVVAVQSLIGEPAPGAVNPFGATEESSSIERAPVMTDEERLAARIERTLGLQLAPVAADDPRLEGTTFRGGLEIVELLPTTPFGGGIGGTSAADEGIREGDILVGLDQWETLSLDNIAYVLTRPESGNFMRIRFYIVRDGETMYGHIVPDSFSRYGAETYGSEPLPQQIVDETPAIVQLRYILPEGTIVMHERSADRRERIAAPIGESVVSYIYPGNASPRNVRITVTASAPATRAALEFLEHNPIPVQVTRDDLDAALGRQYVVRVIYYPSDQDGSDGCEAISSTQLEAGRDPVAEAQSRGDVLAVIHLSHPDAETDETE